MVPYLDDVTGHLARNQQRGRPERRLYRLAVFASQQALSDLGERESEEIAAPPLTGRVHFGIFWAEADTPDAIAGTGLDEVPGRG